MNERNDRAKIEWVSVEDRLPSSGRKVLAFYTNRLGNPRIVIGAYAAKHTIEQDPYADYFDYAEEKDVYYYPEGWYESLDNWEEYSEIVIHEGIVKYWAPLPSIEGLK